MNNKLKYAKPYKNQLMREKYERKKNYSENCNDSRTKRKLKKKSDLMTAWMKNGDEF